MPVVDTPAPGDTYRPTTLNAGPHGTLRGVEVVSSTGDVRCRRFLQVPYARPPTGDLRWRKPVALPDDYSWEDVRGEEFGYVAPQPEYVIKNDEGVVFPSGVPGATLSEDSLTANIWTPPGPAPAGGWPLLVFFHGGWLQIGAPAMTERNDPSALLGDGALRCVVVAPAYRLGVFGFLAGEEVRAENDDGTAGNFGFWDQRLALEWTVANAPHFGASPNLTICGLSAGAYSVQMQLAYDVRQPEDKQLVRRAMLWSNTLPAQPKNVAESQAGFDGLAEVFGIPASASGEDKMRALREVGMGELVEKVMTLKIHTFRAVTDDAFIPSTLYSSFVDGSFARSLAARDISLIVGEVSAEELLYGATNPPSSLADLRVQLANYYAPETAERLLAYFRDNGALPAYADDKELEADSDEWKALRGVFGTMVAGGQVYVPSRAFVRALLANGVQPSRVLRYRVAWKPSTYPTLFGSRITHSDDTWAWWYSRRYGFSDADVAVNRAWLEPVQAFLDGEHDKAAEGWYGGAAPQDGRKLREVRDGKIAVVDDDRWDECMRIAQAVGGK